MDLLGLSGSTHVLPLKRRLVGHLANRINAGHLHGHVIGRLDELLIAEFPVHNTPMSGRTIRQSHLRHERNIEAIHRAGADFVLSYASLGAEAVLALLQGREAVVLGEGFDLFYLPVPRSLEGRTVAESQIRRRSGLNLLALRPPDHHTVPATAATELVPGSGLVLLGSEEERRASVEAFS